MTNSSRVGLVGGGVIGAGWAARFLLNGHDVAIFDPDPEIARKLETVIGNARRAQAQLFPGLAPPEGRLTLADLDRAGRRGRRLRAGKSARTRRPEAIRARCHRSGDVGRRS